MPCAQTRLPGPRGHRDAQASGASAARFDRPARQATEPRAKREAMFALCHGLVVDSTFERSGTSPVHGEFEQLLLACSEGCGLHLLMGAVLTGTRLYYSMLLVFCVQSHYPMIVTSNMYIIYCMYVCGVIISVRRELNFECVR